MWGSLGLTGQLGWERDVGTPGAHWPARLAYKLSSQLRDLVSKRKRGEMVDGRHMRNCSTGCPLASTESRGGALAQVEAELVIAHVAPDLQVHLCFVLSPQ